MRIDPRSEVVERVRAWATEHKVSLITVLPQSLAYVRCAERGMTLFDVPQQQVEEELSHWMPLLQWLRPLLHPAANGGATAAGVPMQVSAVRDLAAPVVDQPKPETISRGPRATETARDAPASTPAPGAVSAALSKGLPDALPLPRFLQRKP